jgi:hypothetical protein
MLGGKQADRRASFSELRNLAVDERFDAFFQ